MGQATDRKVTEIEDTRRRLETDLRDLEERLPSPLRSMKALLGVAVTSTVLATLLLRRRSKRSDGASAEVVVRIVREDG
jgi:hypothetical protein